MAVEHPITVGPLADREVLVAQVGEVAGAVRERALGHRVAETIPVLENEVPVGTIEPGRLMDADASASVAQLMSPASGVLAAETDAEVVARRVADGGRAFLVADADGRYAGVLDARALLGVVVEEHERDLARLGGYLAGSRRARAAAEEAIPRRLWHRIPWLLAGLAGAMCSALLMGAFEGELDANVVVALFVPAIVYMADGVGTQTETVLIRALTAGVTARSIVIRELISGLLIGLVVGAIFFAFVIAGWGEARVAAAVGIALVVSCSIATGVAMLLPSLFQRLGRNPAFGSGPLATVIQDLLSILVYLALVVAIV